MKYRVLITSDNESADPADVELSTVLDMVINDDGPTGLCAFDERCYSYVAYVSGIGMNLVGEVSRHHESRGVIELVQRVISRLV